MTHHTSQFLMHQSPPTTQAYYPTYKIHTAPFSYGAASLEQQNLQKEKLESQSLSQSRLEDVPHGIRGLKMDFGNAAYNGHSNLGPSLIYSDFNSKAFGSHLAEPSWNPLRTDDINKESNMDDDDEGFQDTDENNGDFSGDDKENNDIFRNQSKATLPMSRPVVSNRQQIKLNKEQHGVKFTRDHQIKGMTQWTRHDGLQILVQGVWHRATRHEWHRARFIAEAAQEGRYLYEPARGGHELDRTAFHPPDRELDLVVRERRPAILHQWHPVGDPPAFVHPGYMKVGSVIVIDHTDHPILNWPELPMAISGQCEGLRMEYWRRVNRLITLADIRARMPQMTSGRADLPLRELVASSFGNRMDRGRTKGACIAWNRRDGTLVKERQMLKLMPSDVRRWVFETNSTAHWRDLSNQEIKWILEANKGKAKTMKRASWRALSPATRARREAAAQALKTRREKAKVSATSVNTEKVLGLEGVESPLGRQSNASRDHTKFPPNISALDESINQNHRSSSFWESLQSQVQKRRFRESTKAPKTSPHYSFETDPAVNLENDSDSISQMVGSPEIASHQHMLIDIQESFQALMPDPGNPEQPFKMVTVWRNELPRVDCRLRTPNGIEDIMTINDALELTCQHLRKLVPEIEYFIQTDLNQCYMYQYQEMQLQLATNRPGIDVSILHIRPPWYGRMDAWTAVSLEELRKSLGLDDDGTNGNPICGSKRTQSDAEMPNPKKQRGLVDKFASSSDDGKEKGEDEEDKGEDEKDEGGDAKGRAEDSGSPV
ncbi:MAG: hypothetical protein Q9167_002159 [Letrouitia subvulpina]